MSERVQETETARRAAWAWVMMCAVAAMIAPATAWSQDEAACVEAQDNQLSAVRHWRSLNLDLRGELPVMTPEDVEVLQEQGSVPDEWVERLLSEPGFTTQVGRAHRMLLLNNITNFDDELKSNNFRLSRKNIGTDEDKVYVYFRPDYAEVSRKERRVECENEPHTAFDEQGRALPLRVDRDEDGKVTRRYDGWVEVNPYWAPSETIKVCAFDATEMPASAVTGRSCSSGKATRSEDCGCGEALNWCFADADGVNTRTRIMRALSDDVQMRIEHVIQNKLPYTDLFSSRQAWVNGPLAHYWKHWLDGSTRNVTTEPVSFDANQLPDISFTDENWYPIQLGEEHAGVLTSVPYLVRYQTNRSRANRFYSVFMCSPFQAPEGGLPVTSVREALEPDLQKRNGCAYCHARVEPAAAYWGRWSEYGISYLEQEEFPTYDENCANCAAGKTECSDRCRKNYVTSSLDVREQQYYGMLKSYNFLQDPHHDNVEEGPKALLDDAILNNSFLGCTVDTVARQYLGRTLDNDQEQEVRQQLIQNFAASNYDYTELVKQIVTSPMYKKVQ